MYDFVIDQQLFVSFKRVLMEFFINHSMKVLVPVHSLY